MNRKFAQIITASTILFLSVILAFSQNFKKSKNNLMGDLFELQEIMASDGTADDQFGFSVAIDGNYAVVGMPFDNTTTLNNSGAAYIFFFDGTNWTEQQKLTASDESSFAEFGTSVAISGNTVLIGSPSKSGNTGSAYVFTRSGTTWSEQAILDASDATGFFRFGSSVAIEGDTAVIGSRTATGAVASSGAAYVFTRSGTVWSEQVKLSDPTGGTSDNFGVSVAINGNTILIGADADDDAGPGDGVAHVYTGSGASWTGQAKLTSSLSGTFTNLSLGIDVDLDGDTAVVGAFNSGLNAHIFNRSGSVWTEQLIGTTSTSLNSFGINVAIAGNYILIGDPRDDSSGVTRAGSVHVFELIMGTWTKIRRLIPMDAETDSKFGSAVDISGTIAIAGSPEKDVPPPTISPIFHPKSANLIGTTQGVGHFHNVFLAPTKAPANISGRVLSPKGLGVPQAVVQMTDQNGNVRYSRTNQFGYYRFTEVIVGQTLMFNVFSKRFQFATQVVNFDETLKGLNFIAQ